MTLKVLTRLGDDYIEGHRAGGFGRCLRHGAQDGDRVPGGRGNDRVAGKGKDVVLCGSGRDGVHAARADRVMRDCESVRYG